MPGLSPAAVEAVRFITRSLLAAGVDQSVRVSESVQVQLWPDASEPDAVMRGSVERAKDGAPMDIFAPAEGILGPYEWYADHLREVLRRGQVFPLWVKPRGSKGAIALAAGLTTAVASKSDVRRAAKEILTLPPLRASEAEVKEWAIDGHTAHATPPEWARQLGEHPRLGVQLPPELEMGFSEADCDALGHWLRDSGAKADASAAQAARDAAPAQARREAAIASLPGRTAV